MNKMRLFSLGLIIGFCAILNMAVGSVIKQPLVPNNYKELPFIEKVPKPQLTTVEQKRGYMLFTRPIMEPVYPNTQPLAGERLSELTAFAAQGEFEPLTFSVYPIRELKNFKVTISNLESAGKTIDSSYIDIRLLTYWNVGYPRYTSHSTYRRTPELLEKVSSFSSLAYECQRWWLTIRVPKDVNPGIYKGVVTMQDDNGGSVITIPVKFRVLGFKLLSDPNKHYSAYYYMKNKIQYGGKSDQEIRKMLDNEYQAMADMGLNMIPTMRLDWDSQKNMIVLRHSNEIAEMMKVGMGGPVPVTSSGVISHFYYKTTPGGKVHSHWDITKMPPPECYDQIKQAFKRFVKESKDKNWPEFYCCPIDEVASKSKEFGAKVFKAVKDGGMKTYITKDPVVFDAAAYKDYIDAWCSQPYSMQYQNIISQQKHEYWSYPNHNAGEIKDRLTMCKGGRMTYGFGFWRSGYQVLIPWHWSWVMAPNQFDYLRSRRSGCGQRIAADGTVIPSIYWECFREGIDDSRYIYTLEQAIWERENSGDQRCYELIVQAKAAMQRLWDDINVQTKYRNTGMWASEEFNARRWELAAYITRLLQYPAVRAGQAPSVIVNTQSGKQAAKLSIMERETKCGNIEMLDLSGSFIHWKNQTPEGVAAYVAAAGLNGGKGLQWTVNIDHSTGEKGYPVGWPRIRCDYSKSPIDFTQYDYLKYLIKIESDRNEVDDDVTKLGFTIESNKFFETKKDLGGRQRVWLPVIFNICDLIKTKALGCEPWRRIKMLQLFVDEGEYKDKTRVIFNVGSLQLLRYKTPVIANINSSRLALLPAKELIVSFELMGNMSKDKTYNVLAQLQDETGKTACSVTSEVNVARSIQLDIGELVPGQYQLVLQISVNGQTCSRFSRSINILAGPFYK